jgi:predicted nucleotide-binding protein
MSKKIFASDLDRLLHDVDVKSALKSLHLAVRITSHRGEGRDVVPWASGLLSEPSSDERQLAATIIRAAEKAYGTKIADWDATVVRDVAEALVARALSASVSHSGRSPRGAQAFRETCLARDFDVSRRLSLQPSDTSPARNRWWNSWEISKPAVFIVHSRNDAAVHELAAVLKTMSTTPFVLHDSPARGQSVVESLEAHVALASFAIVLFTVADMAEATTGPPSSARQNVIFELGYLVGRLGRERVCVLAEPGVELPSEYSGVIFYMKDTAGVWKRKLANELSLAGIDSEIDA